VGGYHAGRDQVLILDVARFKYPPHWVPLEALFRAMLPHDAETGRSRGFLRFWRRSEVASLCSIHATDTSWRTLLCQLFNADSVAASSMQELLQRLLRTVPSQALELVRRRSAEPAAQAEALQAQQALWQELEHTEIMQLLRSALPEANVDLLAAALFLLSLPSHVFRCLTPQLRERIEALRNMEQLSQTVREQVEHLRSQAEALDEFSPCPPKTASAEAR
jgi:glutathione gamma-glutamylcysteinyltransferase